MEIHLCRDGRATIRGCALGSPSTNSARSFDQVLYPNASVDDKGEQLSGANKYVLHFDAGKLRPVSVFWNMAMYGPNMLFFENGFGRYSIGSPTDGLKEHADGSLTVLIQKEKPAEVANWLCPHLQATSTSPCALRSRDAAT